MKYIILFLLVLLVACIPEGQSKQRFGVSYEIVVIDSCQYINWCAPYSNSIVHKGNCNNPIHYK